jgi:hypothetical protein
MSTHWFHGITRIFAEGSGHSDILLDLTDVDGRIVTLSLELEPELHPVRDLLVRAINSAARAAEPRSQEAEVVALPPRNGLAWGDPTVPQAIPIKLGKPPALMDDDTPPEAA